MCNCSRRRCAARRNDAIPIGRSVIKNVSLLENTITLTINVCGRKELTSTAVVRKIPD